MNSGVQTQPAVTPGNYLAQQGPLSGVALERHKARCSICRHPRCEDIERDFLDWTSPRELAQTYVLPDFRAIYRHANALGLFDRRRTNIQRAVDCIIEHVGEVDVNAQAVVAAIRIALNEERKWLDSIRRLMSHNLREWEEPPSPEKLARPIPPAYWARIATPQLSDALRPQAEKIAAEQPAIDKKEIAAEPPRPAPDKSPTPRESKAEPSLNAAAAPVSKPPKRSAQPEITPAPADASPDPPPDPYNAPGQVAGLPWPWPAKKTMKKIQFARRRPWYLLRPD